MLSAEAKKGIFSTDSGYQGVVFENSTKKQGGARKIRRKKEEIMKVLYMGGLLIFLMIANTVVQVLLTQSQQDLNMLRSENARLEKELGQLQYEVASLQSCERIQRVATDQLGMRPAQTIGNLYVAFTPPVTPEKPEVTLYLLAGKIRPQNDGVAQRIAQWFSGRGKTLAESNLGW